MRTGMTKILPLQINLGSPQTFGQPFREIERRRTPDVFLEVIAELLLEGAILPRLSVFPLQFQQSRHERFWHIAAAIGAEAAVLIGNRRLAGKFRRSEERRVGKEWRCWGSASGCKG